MAGRATTPDTTNYRQRTLDYLDMVVPFEIAAQSRLGAEQRIQHAQAAYLAVLDCGPTGHGKEQYTGFAALMYGGPTYEQERRAITIALAAMAYQPGGVTWMGRHWCVDHRLCVEAAAYAAADPIDLNTPAEPAAPSDTPPTFLGRPLVDLPTLT